MLIKICFFPKTWPWKPPTNQRTKGQRIPYLCVLQFMLCLQTLSHSIFRWKIKDIHQDNFAIKISQRGLHFYKQISKLNINTTQTHWVFSYPIICFSVTQKFQEAAKTWMFEQAAAISQSDTPLFPNMEELLPLKQNNLPVKWNPSIKSGILSRANHFLNPLDGIFWTKPPFQTWFMYR